MTLSPTRLMVLSSVMLALQPLHASAASDPWILSERGYGPLHTGMSKSDLKKRVGAIVEEGRVGGCEQIDIIDHPGVVVMFEKGKLARVTVHDRAIKTDRGIALGSDEAAVEAVYAPLQVEPHAYSDPPAAYLTYWRVPSRQGVRFETDEARKVSVIHVGDASIRLVEGCS
jgi:urease beta subunit